MITPAQKTIALLRELTSGVDYSAHAHIAMVKEIEKQHPNDVYKQTVMCNAVIDDFTETIYKQWALNTARRNACASKVGQNTLKKGILRYI